MYFLLLRVPFLSVSRPCLVHAVTFVSPTIPRSFCTLPLTLLRLGSCHTWAPCQVGAGHFFSSQLQPSRTLTSNPFCASLGLVEWRYFCSSFILWCLSSFLSILLSFFPFSSCSATRPPNKIRILASELASRPLHLLHFACGRPHSASFACISTLHWVPPFLAPY